MEVWVWIGIVIFAIIIEAASLSLISVWFAAGALISAVLAALGADLFVQIIVFIIASIVLFAILRPFVRRFIKPKNESTNADRIIGQIAEVTEAIDSLNSVGQIKIAGQIWSARTEGEEVVPVGEKVRILSISGVKAVVEKL